MYDLKIGDAATLARLSQGTIRKACDNGALRSYKLPGSSHRRVKATDLREFLVKNSMPTDLVDAHIHKGINKV